MAKIIKTKILKKYSHNSHMGIVTASLWDYILYRRKDTMDGIGAEFGTFIYGIFTLVLALTVALTCGWILLPYWIIMYFKKRREIIKKYGVEYINKTASELWQELETKGIKNDN